MLYIKEWFINYAVHNDMQKAIRYKHFKFNFHPRHKQIDLSIIYVYIILQYLS